MGKIITRMGDGSFVELTESQLKQDLEDGAKDAAERGNVPMLTDDELRYLYEVFASPYKFVSVEPGNECCLSYDAGTLKVRRVGIMNDRIQALQIYEKLMGADTMELAHVDYSFKPIKPIVTTEQPVMEQAQLVTIAPVFYGAMPNLGLYSQPDGPFPNPGELLPQGKIKESRASHEDSVEAAVADIVYVASCLHESGADGINFDTVGAAGDPDFLASLKAAEILTKKYPGICIEVGMAGEFILGMHGEMTWHGKRLAGLYPLEQMKLCEEAGVRMFGPVVNTVTGKSTPWNLSRACTFIKPVSEQAKIPIHPNMGMGVGAVPVNDHPPADVVSRCSKAMVEVCRLDGL